MILLLKNWLDFLRHHTFLFVIMMLAQLVSVLCIYFVYGVFQNNLYTLLEGEHDSYRLAASLNNKEDEIPMSDLIKEMAEDWNFDIDFVYLVAKDEKGNEFQDRVSYENGQFQYSETVKDNVQGDMEGQFASEKEYANGEKVVVTNGDEQKKMGTKITIDDQEYKVIGINKANEKQEYEIPFTAFPKGSKMNYISVSMKNLPTRADYDKFSEELGKYNADVEDFAITNYEDIKKQYSLLLVSVLLALLSGGNLFIVYCYIFKQRKDQMVACRLYGCTRGQARRMFFGEILFNMSLAVAAGLCLYRFLIYPLLLNWYEYLYRIYGVGEYVVLTSIYVGITILFGWMISGKMSRLSLADFRRGE